MQVRNFDRNHLILGVRGQNIASTPCPGRQNLCEDFYKRQSSGHTVNMTSVWMAMRGLVDVFNFHDYSDVPPADELQRVFDITNIPVMVGEFSFTAADSNLPNTHGARSCPDRTGRKCLPGRPFRTQTQRAQVNSKPKPQL